ncbi:hypothetical protein ACFLYO_04170 [Chloroflexota bacterium]
MIAFWREDFSLTKRQMGWLLLVAGGLLFVALISIDPLLSVVQRIDSDRLSPDRQFGVGPKQQIAILGSLLIAVLGLTLIPLAEPPADTSWPEARAAGLPVWWRRVTRLLLIFVLLALLFYLVVYVVYAVNIIQFPFDYDQGEGFELVDTVMFSQFRWPYQDTEAYPFYSSNYPPLFHLIAVPFVWLFGEAYWYGRLLGFLGTLVTAGAIGYAVYRSERHRLIAVISGLAYLASNYIYHIGPLFRQHLFMVMLETLAVVLLANVHQIEAQGSRRRRLVLGLGLLLAAGFTKQLAIFTCVAVFVYLFIYSPRRAFVWGVLFALVAGGIFLFIDVSTGGQWWLNTITANVNPFVPGQFEGLFTQWWGLHGALILMAGLVVLYELYFDAISIYSIWFVVAVLSTYLSGKWGAGDSYYATAIVAACILSGIFAARTFRGTWRWSENTITRLLTPVTVVLAKRRGLLVAVGRGLIPVLYLFYAAAVFHMPTEGAIFSTISRVFNVQPNTSFGLYDSAGWTVGYAVIGQIPTETDVTNGWELVNVVAEAEGPVISEDAAFSILAGKDVIGNPTQLRNLYNNQLYDPARLNDMLENQEFDALILRALFYPDPVLYQMMEAYNPERVIPMNGFEYIVFRPDPDWPVRRGLRDAIYALDGATTIDQIVAEPENGIAQWLQTVLAQVGWVPVEIIDDQQSIFGREDDRVLVVWIVESTDDHGALVRVLIEPAP